MADDGITKQSINISPVVNVSPQTLRAFFLPSSYADWVILAGIILFLIDGFTGTPITLNIGFIVFLTIFFSIYIMLTKQGRIFNILLLLLFAFFDILLATKAGIIPSTTIQSIFQSQFLDRSVWPLWAILGIFISRNENQSKSGLTKLFIIVLVGCWAILLFSLITDTSAYQEIKTQIEQNIPQVQQNNPLADVLGKEIFLEDSDINTAINTCFEKRFQFNLIFAKYGSKSWALSDPCVQSQLEQIKSLKTRTAITNAIEKKESQEQITADIYEEFSDFTDKVKHQVTARIDNSGEPLTALLDFNIGPTGQVQPNFHPFNYEYKLLSVDITEQNKYPIIDEIQDDVFVTFNTEIDKSNFKDKQKLVYTVTMKDIETTGELTLLFMDLEELAKLKANYVDQNQKKIREPIKGTSSEEQYNKESIVYHRNLFTFYKVPELIDAIYPFGLVSYRENKLGAISIDLIGKEPVIGAIAEKEYVFVLDISNINEKLKPGISKIKSLELIAPSGMSIISEKCNLKPVESVTEKTLSNNILCSVKITDLNAFFNNRNPKEIFPPVPITFTAKMKFDYQIEKTIEVGPLEAES